MADNNEMIMSVDGHELAKTDADYATPTAIAKHTLKALEELKEKYDQLDRRFNELEHNQQLRPYQNSLLEKERRRRVVAICGGYNAAAYQNRAIATQVFKAIMKEYRRKFGVASYQETKLNQFDKAAQFYQHWQPDFELQEVIDAANDYGSEI